MHIELSGGVCVLQLNGRFRIGLDAEAAHAKAALEATCCRNVIADCGQVSFLDAAGIGFIAELYRSLQDADGKLVLANVNPRIREALKITRLDTIIPIFDTDDEALAAFAADEQTFAAAV